MADGYFPTLVSKTADANAVANPIEVRLSDGTTSISPLTDTELRATDVNVNVTNASIAVTGPLTDTELRASDVPVTVSNFPATQTVDGTVAVTQSTSPWVVSATALDIRALTLASDAVKVSANSTANSVSNPIYVNVVNETVVSGVVQDYKTATVAAGLTDTHSYTAVNTMNLSQVSFASSGASKAELKIDGVSKWVGFIPKEGGVESKVFDPVISVATTKVISLVVTNRENQSQDVYSTIEGFDA